MKMSHIRSVSLLTTALFAFWGCSDSASDSVSSSDIPNNSATSDDRASGLASNLKKAEEQIASVQKNANEEAAKLKAEVSAALARQREELLSEMNANTSQLTSQMGSIKQKYDSLKDSLPEEVLKVIKEQIPDLETSITKLKEMIAKFNPESIEELNTFKQKYQKEYEAALSLMKKASALLENSGVQMPKLF